MSNPSSSQTDGLVERLREIKEREAKATPGPWTLVPEYGTERTIRALSTGGAVSGVVASVWANWVHPGQNAEQEANAAFLAAARSDIPFLLGVIDRLTASRDREADAYDPQKHREVTGCAHSTTGSCDRCICRECGTPIIHHPDGYVTPYPDWLRSQRQSPSLQESRDSERWQFVAKKADIGRYEDGGSAESILLFEIAVPYIEAATAEQIIDAARAAESSSPSTTQTNG